MYVCMYMYIHICVYMYVYIYIYIHVYAFRGAALHRRPVPRKGETETILKLTLWGCRINLSTLERNRARFPSPDRVLVEDDCWPTILKLTLLMSGTDSSALG